MRIATLLIVAGMLPQVAVADAQSLSLTIDNGRVTMDARSVPVPHILREWARIGSVEVVNGDRVPGASVTLQLTGVSEREALAAILEGVSGYVLAMRPAGASGTAVFSRIVILPASSTSPASPQALASETRASQPRVVTAPPVAEPVISQDGSTGSAQPGATFPPTPRAPSAPSSPFAPVPVPSPSGAAVTAQVAPSAPAAPPVPASPFAPRSPRPPSTPAPATADPPAAPAATAPPPTGSPFFRGPVTARPGEVVPIPTPASASPSDARTVYPEGMEPTSPPPQ